jgi:hypothetical protein
MTNNNSNSSFSFLPGPGFKKSDMKTQQSPPKRCETFRTPEDNGKKKRKVVKSETS